MKPSRTTNSRRLGNARLRFDLVCGLIALPFLFLSTAGSHGQQVLNPLPVAGVWYDDTGEGAVEIVPCADRLCGHIVWLKNPNDRAGRPLTDGLNPEPAQRRRPVCGLQVIGDLKPQPNGSWDAGWIYDPKEGKSYDVEIKLRAPDRLQVMGYLGTKFLSETFVWKRVTAEIQRCA